MSPEPSQTRIFVAVAVLGLVTLTFVFMQPKEVMVANPEKSIKGSTINYNKVQQLSWKPRVFYYRGFLSEDTCNHILELGKDKVERSMTVGPNGTSIVNPHRTSYGYFLSREANSDAYIKAIEQKIASWTGIPAENGEAMNLLRYDIGQEYKPHHDYFGSSDWTKSHGNRVATVLMYLADVEDGGETIFPSAEGGPLLVKPRRGDAILFWNFTPEGNPDPLSLHGAKPVVKGQKWSLTRWIREKKYR